MNLFVGHHKKKLFVMPSQKDIKRFSVRSATQKNNAQRRNRKDTLVGRYNKNQLVIPRNMFFYA